MLNLDDDELQNCRRQQKLKVGFLTIVAMLQRLSREERKNSQQFCLRAGRYARMTPRNYHPFRVHQLDPASKSRLSTLESPLFMFTACRYHIQLVASNLRHLNACDWEYKSICIICDETFFYNCIHRRTWGSSFMNLRSSSSPMWL